MIVSLKCMDASAPLETIRLKYIVFMQIMVANVLLRNNVSISIDEW